MLCEGILEFNYRFKLQSNKQSLNERSYRSAIIKPQYSFGLFIL